MPERTIIITGASDGIGAAAAKTLTETGEKVVLVGRNPRKTEAVARELGADHFVADFSKLDDVRTLARQLLVAYPRIDVLANNAGGIMGERAVTVDGNELTLQVNHLAPFLLTNLMIDRLAESNATVIGTSSVANKLFANLDIRDLQNLKHYTEHCAYGDAKLANILFAKELDVRYRDRGINSAVFHPGVVATNFSADSSTAMRLFYRSFLNRFLATPAKGADTLVWLATSTPGVDWPLGGFFAKRREVSPNPTANDRTIASALWEQSADLVGLDRVKPAAS
jgi:NAD(P)-dependent dehydrogenase (short-subunit alcohol dehydrogenase family)